MSESQEANARTLTDTYETIDRLSDTIHQLDAQADEALRVAHILDNEIADIRGVMAPITRQHTPHTWMGRSAVTSRHRLDTHDIECTTAIRSIDQIIDDLRSRAVDTLTRSESTRDALAGARRRAVSLEFELGRFDDVAI